MEKKARKSGNTAPVKKNKPVLSSGREKSSNTAVPESRHNPTTVAVSKNKTKSPGPKGKGHRTLPQNKKRIGASKKKKAPAADDASRLVMAGDIPEKYRTIIDTMQEGYFEADLKGRLTFVNKALCDIGGYTAEESIGRVYRHYADEENIARVFEIFSRIYKTGKPEKAFNWEIIRKDGTRRTIEASISLIHDAAEQPAGFRGVIHDITKRKEAEEKLEWELKVNRIINEISGKILDVSLTIHELADTVTVHVKNITGSEQAFVSELYLSDARFNGHARSGCADRSNMIGSVLEKFQQAVSNGGHGRAGTGQPAKTLNIHEAFYSNDASTHELFRDIPAGHVLIHRFLVSPAVMRGELLGLIVTVNAPRDYTASDLDAVKRLAGLYAIAINRIRSEDQIRVSLKEKELLLKEIHHRVKNNMQIISSLLGLQSMHVKDPRDAHLFEVSQNRVRSMALVHEKLYQSDSLSGLDFQDYITDLVGELTNSYYMSERISILINAHDTFVDIDDAIPCSLIVFELVSNALKHGFPDGRKGEISIDFYREGGTYILRICDNGAGLPAGFDYRNTTSLGLQLVNALAQQLKGTVNLDTTQNTVFTIAFRGHS